jgi:pilus assembly protein FimV
MKKHFTAHIIFAATALASQQVWALGFGRAVSDAVLGQAFTFTVPVHVEPGEHFGLECVSTQVYYGDSQLLSSQVRTELLPGSGDYGWLVKITASAAVAEPIIEVALNASCDRPFTRRFSVFADPPTLGTPAAQLPQVGGAGTAPAAASTFTPRSPAAAAPAAPPTGFSTAYAARHGSSGPATGRARVVRKGPTMALANELNAPPAAAPSLRHGAADVASARQPGPRVTPPPADDASRLVLDTGVPHLKLDMEEPVIPPPSSASGAAIGLSDLDDPDLRQLKALEQNLQAVRRDSQAQRDQAARLQAQLAEAQSRSDWTPWLLGLLAIAIAAIAALLWKLRQQNRIAHSDWFNQSQIGTPAPPAPAPAPEPEPVVKPPPVAPAADVREPGSVAAPASTSVEDTFIDLPDVDDGDARGTSVAGDHSATRPLDRQAMAAAMAQEQAPRELSVEELLDLEQQADFFIALGQEDAAVDLLMSHLRSAGGQSPLPYTKLLEIYKRQGDRGAYERTRARFNRRFNAYAPDWDTGPTTGRSLEDYAETIALLEGAWASPIDSMAILEALLFKRDDSSELFDLPAYRDVLVLYSLARDLWQHGGGDNGTQVDVLLPLGDFDPTAPMPIYPSAREVNERAMPGQDLGLDLESVDAEGDTGHGMLTSFEMNGFEPVRGGGHVDLELPQPDLAPAHGDDDVHATLDELSLSPVAPTKPKSALDWHDGDTPDSELPTRR